jgi:hypothetical protein
MDTAESLCECGAPATANGRECPACFHDRLATVRSAFTPTRTAGAGQIDPEKSRRWDSRLDDYRRTRAEGSQPKSTRRRDIEAAKAASDRAGRAFRADRAGRERQAAAV